MATAKSERLLNLLITLLVAQSFVPKERLRRVIEAYRDLGDAAFEKMFERDKEELRALGVPVEVGSHDAFFDDELGYRIPKDAFALPEIALEADEAAVIGLAARVWQHAGLAARTSDALVKLKAAGIGVDRAALDIAQPRLDASEPSFADFWDAVQERTPVRFAYRRPGAEATERHLQPWGVVATRGRWYVVGHDTDRDEPRVFRLSRVQGGVRRDGGAGSFTVPPDLDVRALTRSLLPDESRSQATVLVRPGTGLGLRRQAVSTAAPEPDQAPAGEWERLEVPYGSEDALADEVLSYGSDAVAVAPESLRALVVERLRGVAGGAR